VATPVEPVTPEAPAPTVTPPESSGSISPKNLE
ncbi:unnamed protein product, partial [Allacma fusca]